MIMVGSWGVTPAALPQKESGGILSLLNRGERLLSMATMVPSSLPLSVSILAQASVTQAELLLVA